MGMWAEYFAGTDFAGPAILQRVESGLDCAVTGNRLPDELVGKSCSVRWAGTLKVAESAPYLAQFLHTGTCRLFIDDCLVLESARSPAPGSARYAGGSAQVELEKDHAYRVRVEFANPETESTYAAWLHFGLAPDAHFEDELAEAVEIARQSDVAIVFAGMPGWVTSINV